MLHGYKIIAVCLAGIQDSACVDFVTQLNKELSPKGYRIFVYHISTDLDWNEKNEDSESLVFELIDYSVVDAVIIMDEKIKDTILVERIIDQALEEDVPILVIDGEYEDCVNIRFDYAKGFEKIVRHVFEEHKPKNPHMMAGYKENKFSQERIDVFQNMLEEYGYTYSEQMISYGNFWALPTIEATTKLIKENRVPDAIICANDIMAINVIAVLNQHGYKVPEDVIVTGFDGIEEIYYTHPTITSAECSNIELATEVADLIQQEVHSGEYYVMPRFIVAESCGCNGVTYNNILNNFQRLNGRFYRFEADNRILTKISENIQRCLDIREVAQEMENDVLDELCCVVNRKCIDETVDPMAQFEQYFDEYMYLIHDYTNNQALHMKSFQRIDILPDIERILERGCPLIFAELGFVNVPFGYVCFCYEQSDTMNYGKIPLIITALNNGIGGMLNRRYQNYLNKRIEFVYKHDALTGMLNRLGFQQEKKAFVEKAQQSDEMITIVLADLDGLKYINDNFGHIAGDRAIFAVANALKQSCPEDSLCVRFGGDEMLAVIEGAYEKEVLRERIDALLEQHNRMEHSSYQAAVSLGVLQVRARELEEFDDLIKETDYLMYEEKKRRKANRK